MKRVSSMEQLHSASRSGGAFPAPVGTAGMLLVRSARRVQQTVLAQASIHELYQYKDRTLMLGRSVAKMTRQLSAVSVQVRGGLGGGGVRGNYLCHS